MFSRRNSPLLLNGIIAGIAYLAVFILHLVLHDFDPAVFVQAGDTFADPTQTPLALTVYRDSIGYDGQFFYRLAIEPMSRDERAVGITFDYQGSYRQQRIVYPLAAGVLGGFNPTAVLWTLPLVNLIALIALAVMGGVWARDAEIDPLWGLALAFAPGLLLSFMRDMSEPVALSLVVAGLLGMRHKRMAISTIAFTAAALTRETTLIVPLTMLCVWGLSRLRPAKVVPPSHWAPVVIPIVVYVCWTTLLTYLWRSNPAVSSTNNFAFPGTAFVALLLDSFPPSDLRTAMTLVELMLFGLICLLGVVSFRASPIAAYEKLPWVLYLGLALAASSAIWTEDWSFLRVLSGLWIFSGLIILPLPGWRKYLYAAATVFLWVLLALHRTQLTAIMLKGSIPAADVW